MKMSEHRNSHYSGRNKIFNNWKPKRRPPFFESKCGWYTVTVKNPENNYDFAMNCLKTHVKPLDFQYYNVDVRNREFSFWICNFDLAKKLYEYKVHKYIDYKKDVTWCVKASSAENYVLSTCQIDALNKVLCKRYDPTKNLLDLSNLHCDKDFLDEKYFLSLKMVRVSNYVYQHIKVTLPSLSILDLSKNDLTCLPHFSRIAPRLKVVDASKNDILGESEIEKLQGLHLLETLMLEGNPWMENFTNLCYIKKVKELFPRLVTLDNIVINPLQDTKPIIPIPRRSFMCCVEASHFSRAFVEKYFNVFDSTCRQNLTSFYDKNAKFSMCAIDGAGCNQNIRTYLKLSRNLLRTQKILENEPTTLLFEGPAMIIDILKKLPDTTHLIDSFMCDCPIFSLDFPIQMTVCGLFKENHTNILYWFNRVFIVTCNADEIFILNEQLFITSASQEQFIQQFHDKSTVESKQETNVKLEVTENSKSVALANVKSEERENSVSEELVNFLSHELVDIKSEKVPSTKVHELANFNAEEIDSEAQRNSEPLAKRRKQIETTSCSENKNSHSSFSTSNEKLKHFSLVNNLNRSYATKCLQEVQWDYEEALSLFNEMNAKGLVPPEAFIKKEPGSF